MESITIVDLLLVAPLGDFSVAAFGIGGALIAFLISIQFAIGNGTQLVLSRAVGGGDIQNIGMQVASGWALSIGFSLITVTGLFFGVEPLINFITQWLIAIPTCALLVFSNAPLALVFGVILLDEILKFYPFRRTLMRELDRYALETN